jgi:sodium-dependent phosphate cotransporter
MPSHKHPRQSGRRPSVLVWLGVLALVFLLLVGVATIGDGFKWISGGADGAQAIFAFADNPVVGVVLGTLATALVQSSSTVTSVIVGLVAGGVPVEIAVPMIMGANMGTTITNTIVSLGNFRDRSAFKKSFAAATVHDFFNLYSIVIFLPVEAVFHPLEKSAALLAGYMSGGAEASIGGLNVVAMATKPFSPCGRLGVCKPALHDRGLADHCPGYRMVMASVLYLGKLLRAVMTGRAKGLIDTAIGRGPVTGIARVRW